MGSPDRRLPKYSHGLSLVKQRVKNPNLITPSYEDRGLFKKPLAELIVNLIPKFRQNTRGDLIIKGLVQNGGEVDVFFAGRRKSQAGDLVALLKLMWEDAVYVARNRVSSLEPKDVRLPTRVLGSWRTRIVEDDEEWYSREYQLLVARWAYNGVGGEFCSYGELPFVEQELMKTDESRTSDRF